MVLWDPRTCSFAGIILSSILDEPEGSMVRIPAEEKDFTLVQNIEADMGLTRFIFY